MRGPELMSAVWVLTLVGCQRSAPADRPLPEPTSSDTAAPPTTDTETGGSTDTAGEVPTDTGSAAPLSWTSISAGSDITCGTLSDGRIICFGDNLGDILLNVPAGFWTAVVLGGDVACALDPAGMPFCWGDAPGDGNGCGDTPPPAEAFDRLEMGSYLRCGERADDTVACWGCVPVPGPDFAEMGGPYRDFAVGNSSICMLDSVSGAPTCLQGFTEYSEMANPPPGLDLSDVAVGQNHACGVNSLDGSGVCWGADHTAVTPYLQPPPGVYGEIESEGGGTCQVDLDGMVTCFGLLFAWPKNGYGPPLGSYSMLTVGAYHACAIDTITGEMVCWGGYGYSDKADPPLLADLALPKETG